MAHSGPALTAQEVWQQLLEGNQRFVKGSPLSRNLPALRESLIKGQNPRAAVLCCSDSRVPAEFVFDQCLGDIFVVRTAGLVLEPTSLGSLEYAVAHLHVPLLVINGHEFCGAVTAAVHHPDLDESHITAVVRQIAPSATQARERGLSGPELVEAANDLHLKSLYDALSPQSPIMREALAARRLELVLSKYFLTDGRVEVLDATF
ncbi:MAG: carbonic anhydrase [Syntrophobacterales bacterium]|jgi:carbonic anhydrase